MKFAVRRAAVVLLFALLLLPRVSAQVTFDRLLHAADEAKNWITYNGNYSSNRFSQLRQITPENVKFLEQKWVFQGNVMGNWEATPLVDNGIMYLTQRPNDIIALDAKSGRAFWMYRYNTPADQKACCGSNNRGVAILGNRVFMGTLDAHLVAVDAATGRQLWDTTVADYKLGYSITHAPLVIKDKILVGVGGGELGIRGFVAAYDAASGKEVWRFYTIPGPGEPGHETWKDDDWKTGGGPVWITGSYDPTLNLTYWGVGNPGPDWNPEQRHGDNLYSDSVIALDPDTGKLRWHFQFTPNDSYDYDSVQIPVLADMNWNGTPVKLILWANRNGFFYALDRETGRFLVGRPFVKVNWASGLDEKGRPIQTPPKPGEVVYPGNQGGTNWYPPSFSPRTGLFYFSIWDNYGTAYRREEAKYQPGRYFVGGTFTVAGPAPNAPGMPTLSRGPINNWTEAVGTGAVVAVDPKTGERKWTFEMTDVTDSGILTTASDLLFTGGREGYFQAVDARTGKLLWKSSLGGQIVAGPMTYEVDGKQYVATISGMNLVTFALRDDAPRTRTQ
jgi:alcohol dehydrogenase (cytochrome c)